MNTLIWYAYHDPDQNYIGGGGFDGYDDAGHLLYSVPMGDPTYIAVFFPTLLIATPNGLIYAGMGGWEDGGTFDPRYGFYSSALSQLVYVGDIHDLTLVRKYRQTGDRIPFPAISVNGTLSAMAVDSAGNVIIGGEQITSIKAYSSYPFSPIVLRKFSADGDLLWEKAPTKTDFSAYQIYYLYGISSKIYSIFVDASDNIYTVGSYGEINKYNSAGVVQWTNVLSTLSFDEWRITVDSYNNVYVVGSSNLYYPGGDNDLFDIHGPDCVFFDTNKATKHIIKFDDDGNLLAFADMPGVSDVFTALKIIIVGEVLHIITLSSHFAFSTATLVKIPGDYGTPSQMSKYLYDRCVIRSDGVSYYAGNRNNFYDNRDYSLSIALIENRQLPSISLPIALSSPATQGDRYSAVPAIPLRFWVQIPRILRDYLGAPLPTIYRLFLSGSPDLELPLEQFTCRRNGSDLMLTVICPALNDDQIDGITARADGDLVLMRGVRFRDGREQVDEMIRVRLNTMRWDAGGDSASATLDGTQHQVVSSGAKTRTLTGISYRNSINGARRVRCVVDTYLEPGDTAALGAGESLIVSDITYSVSTSQSSMEVMEATPT